MQPFPQGPTMPSTNPTFRTMLPTFQSMFPSTGVPQQVPQQVPPYVPTNQQQAIPSQAVPGVASPHREFGSSNAHSVQTDGHTRFL